MKCIKFRTNTGEYKMIDKKAFMKNVERWRKLRTIAKRNRIIEEMESEDI